MLAVADALGVGAVQGGVGYGCRPLGHGVGGVVLPFEQAAVSWYRNVYSPIVKVIREEHLLFQFPGYTEGDMYLWMVRTWDELKRAKKDQNVPIEDAADAVKKSGRGSAILRYVRYFLSKLRKD